MREGAFQIQLIYYSYILIDQDMGHANKKQLISNPTVMNVSQKLVLLGKYHPCHKNKE